MNDENLCNNGYCKKVRSGEERHLKHLNEKKQKIKDKEDTWRNSNQVQSLFFALAILGVIIGYLSTSSQYATMPIMAIALSILSFILGALAFAVFNKGMMIKTEDRIRRIEAKLDRILEHRDDVFQNK